MMGRKGVSKRKTSTAKSPVVTGKSGNSVVGALARATESPVLQSAGKGDAVSTGKGGKKK
jgi:hypothetical protein